MNTLVGGIHRGLSLLPRRLLALGADGSDVFDASAGLSLYLALGLGLLFRLNLCLVLHLQLILYL